MLRNVLFLQRNYPLGAKEDCKVRSQLDKFRHRVAVGAPDRLFEDLVEAHNHFGLLIAAAGQPAGEKGVGQGLLGLILGPPINFLLRAIVGV